MAYYIKKFYKDGVEYVVPKGDPGNPGIPGPRGNGITSIETVERTGDGETNDITIKTTDNPIGQTFHVKNGHGITAIDVIERTGNGATNDIIIKTSDNPSGDVLHVSNGHGIDNITERTSSQDGGDNIITVHTSDGKTYTLTVTNGSKGKTGDSYQPIEDISGLVIAHELGQSESKVMSQKGVTDALYDVMFKRWVSEPFRYVDQLILSGANSLGEEGTYATNQNTDLKYKLAYIQVSKGDNIRVICDNLVGNVYAYFSEEPPALDVSATIIYGNNAPVTPLEILLTASGDGYLGVLTQVPDNTKMPKFYKALFVNNEASVRENRLVTTQEFNLDMVSEIAFSLTAYSTWANSSSGNIRGKIVGITPGKTYIVTSILRCVVGILNTNTTSGGQPADLSNDYPSILLVSGESKFVFTAPSDAHYIYLQTVLSNGDNSGVAISEAEDLDTALQSMVDASESDDGFESAISSFVHDTASLANISSVDATNYLILNVDGTTSTSRPLSVFWVDTFPLSDDKIIFVTGRAANGINYPNACLCCIYDENDQLIKSYKPSDGKPSTTYIDLMIAVPDGAAYIKVNSSNNHVVGVKTATKDYTVVHPMLERGSLTPSTGGFVEAQATAGGSAVAVPINIRTARFIDVHHNESVILTSDVACECRAVYYDSSYSRIGDSGSTFIQLTANTPQTIELAGAYYMKVYFRLGTLSQNIRTPMLHLSLKGIFDKDFERLNVRSADDGYQTVAVEVPVINAACTNTETDAVQDSGTNYGVDYGLLALPETYTNDGNPTRLIIYCHGAGVNYDKDTTRFPSTTHLLPEYWLSEGYAILDMDGECSATDSDQHTLIPESVQCYLAAYKWVVRNFNICQDGVFLGGRSMGGGMSMSLLECGQIPVIAACLNVPVLNTLWWWSYMHQDYRARFATKAGFVGTQPNWGGHNELSSTEWAYLKVNFDAMRRWSPLWRCISDLPTDVDVLMNDAFRTGVDERNVPEEVALYGSLHAQVKAPVKIFDNREDTSVPFERNAMLMYKMLLNGGQEVELRMFDTSDDQDVGLSAHFYELRLDRCVTWTNSRGVELTNVPVVYIEMLAFWRRYEFKE